MSTATLTNNSDNLAAILETISNLPEIQKEDQGTVIYDESTKTLTIIDE